MRKSFKKKPLFEINELEFEIYPNITIAKETQMELNQLKMIRSVLLLSLILIPASAYAEFTPSILTPVTAEYYLYEQFGRIADTAVHAFNAAVEGISKTINFSGFGIGAETAFSGDYGLGSADLGFHGVVAFLTNTVSYGTIGSQVVGSGLNEGHSGFGTTNQYSLASLSVKFGEVPSSIGYGYGESASAPEFPMAQIIMVVSILGTIVAAAKFKGVITV